MFDLLFGETSSWIISTVLSAAAGALMTWAARHRERWARPALYGVLTFAALQLGIASVRVGNALVKAPAITVSNADDVVADWSREFGFKLQERPKEKDEDESVFKYEIEDHVGRKLTINQWADKKRYLNFSVNVVPSTESAETLKCLTPEQATIVLSHLRTELAKMNTEYDGAEWPLAKVRVQRSIPISDEMTENEFFDAVQDVTNTMIVIENTLRAEIFRLDAQRKQSGPCTPTAMPGSAQ
jgi:hypothetical protein